MSSVATVHRAVAAGFLALAAAELFFAGLIAFGATTSYAHRDVGSLMMAVAALLAVLAVVDRPGARQASIGLAFAMLAQVLLGVWGDEVDVLGGLHGVLAIGVVYAGYRALLGAPLLP